MLEIGSKFGQWMTFLALVPKLATKLSHFHCHIALECHIGIISLYWVQFSTSRMAKNGGPVFSAVCGSKLIPISAPEPYKHRGCYRLLFFTNRALFLCPTYTHPIRSFQGISSRPFIGENVFWSVPQNRMSTENAVGCLFLSLTLTFYCFHKFAVPHAAFCSKRPNRISHGSNSDFFWIWHVFWTLSIGCVYVGQRKSTRLVNKK